MPEDVFSLICIFSYMGITVDHKKPVFLHILPDATYKCLKKCDKSFLISVLQPYSWTSTENS